MKTCPFCAEEIQDAAIVCKHCQRNLTRTPASLATHVLFWLTLAVVGYVIWNLASTW
jgi:hypothetical protein